MSEHLRWYKKIAADGTCLGYTQAANEEAVRRLHVRMVVSFPHQQGIAYTIEPLPEDFILPDQLLAALSRHDFAAAEEMIGPPFHPVSPETAQELKALVEPIGKLTEGLTNFVLKDGTFH
jgi:hypothetical protein